MDVNVVEGGAGTLRVAGWAYDPDDPGASLAIHVYVGGPAGSGAWGDPNTVADMDSPDVTDAFGVGGRHRFDRTISLPVSGACEVYVYAINVGEGGNSCLGPYSASVAAVPHDPEGSLDVAEGHTSSVFVSGWAFDPDDPGAPLSIHVYIGGPAGVGEGRVITADQPRQDVNGAYGITGAHGYSGSIATGLSGAQDVYVYAINVGDGDNAFLGSESVEIAADATPPAISDVEVSDVSAEGYTVSCAVADDVGVARVAFPTWTAAGGQDDIVWHEGARDGDRWSFRVSASDHGGEAGQYLTHVYAWDDAGNCANVGQDEFPALLVGVGDSPDPSRDGWVDLPGGGKGYAVGGRLVTGWLTVGEAKYYFHEDGAMAVGWADVEVDGKTMHYYFNPASGNLVRNTWFTIDGKKYYFRPSGNLATGWATISDGGVDKKYYFEDDGTLVAGCWRDIDTGQGYAGHYYFRPSGAMATGWATIDGQKYWFRPSGNMATGFTTVEDGQKRYFDDSGAMLVGWQEIGGNTFYFRPSGAMQVGWADLDGSRYYFRPSGIMQTGTATIDGKEYAFNDKGVLVG